MVLRHAHRLTDGFAPPAVAATTFVPLLAAVLVSPAAPVTLLATAAPSVPAPARPPARTPSPPAALVNLPLVAPAALEATPVAAVLPSPGRTAATETPDDVVLTAVGTPADGRPVIVAIGRGRACTCEVLLQSLAGGTSWSAAAGPPLDATQLAVPPDYPSDPRIFAGVSPFEVGGAPYMATRFGAPFQALSALPAGMVALSGHFDDGDPRLFVSATTGVWSVALASSGPAAGARQEVATPSSVAAGNAVTALATPPPRPGSPALLAWVPALATAPGLVPSVSSSLLRCPVSGSCSRLAAIGADPWALAVDHGSGDTVVAYDPTAAWLSRTAGASLHPLTLPAGVSSLQSVALVGTAATPWLSTTGQDGTQTVWMATPSGWSDATSGAVLLRRHVATLVPIDTRRLLAVMPDAGYRCTWAQLPSHWLPRCPAT